MGYFLRLESPTKQANSLLHTIEKNFLDLRVLRQEVEDQKRLMESIEREVSGFTVHYHLRQKDTYRSTDFATPATR